MTKPFSARTLFPIAPFSQCRTSIIIPARDEAGNLDDTLRAAINQIDLNKRRLDPRTFEILVLANNCTDESAAVARRWSRRANLPPVHIAEINLPESEAHVGRARRILMDEALRRLRGRRAENDGVIASTDADTRVAPDWIAATLYEIDSGAEAVGGRILIKKDRIGDTSAARRYYLRDAAFYLLITELEHLLDPQPHDPFPRHHHHFGASFAVTAETYERSGGLPPLPQLEDVAFFDLLQQIDARFRHSPLVRVETSARHTGRVAVGLSQQLNKWARLAENDALHKVADAGEMVAWFNVRRRLRSFWENAKFRNLRETSEIENFARSLKISPFRLRREILESKTFGVLARFLWLEIKEKTDWNRRFPVADIRKSTADLRFILEKFRKGIDI